MMVRKQVICLKKRFYKNRIIMSNYQLIQTCERFKQTVAAPNSFGNSGVFIIAYRDCKPTVIEIIKQNILYSLLLPIVL